MRRKLAIIGVGVALLAAALVGLGLAAFDDEETIKGPNAERAARAALQSTGGGTLLGVEKGDDGNSVYEVEIRTSDGNVAEVLLDRNFAVMETVSGDDDDGGDDD